MSNSTRCLYNRTLEGFCLESSDSISGKICGRYNGNLTAPAIEAWNEEISVMKQVLSPYREEQGEILFEYDIPRLGKRIDVVLLLKGIVFCLEFKTGESDRPESAIDQVLDYALDLKNFHKYSQSRLSAPILLLFQFE